MRCIVCLKAVRGDYVSGNQKDQNEYVINPYDLFPLQDVLRKREKEKVWVSCISMGGENIRDSLIKSMALGADEVFWLSDCAFAGSDTVATSYTLSEGIKKAGNRELVICGGKAVDGETGQVGIGISERLKIPCICNVDEIICLDSDSCMVCCSDEKEEKIVKVWYPAVLIFQKFTTKSNTISLPALKKAQRKPIPVWNADDMGLDKNRCGMKGSKTQVLDVASSLNRKNGKFIEGTISEKVKFLHDKLQRRSDIIE